MQANAKTSVEDFPFAAQGTVPLAPNSSLIELIRSFRALFGVLRTCVDWQCQPRMD